MGRQRLKKDTGIATIKSKDSKGKVTEFKMEEAVRDALQARDWSGPQKPSLGISSEPDWDTMTTNELREHRYSGFRINKLALRVELWVLGRVAGHRRLQDVAKNPAVLANLHEQVFATTGTVLQVDVDKTKIKTH